MTRGLAGIPRRLAPFLLVPTLWGLPGPGRAESPLPLVLEEVATGNPAELTSGAEALHLVFFAPWCPVCVAELKRLGEMEQRWGEAGYRLVLIAVRHRNSRERLLRFTQQHRPPGVIYFDVSGEAQRSFAAGELPAHLLIDTSGQEIGRWDRLDDGLEEAVRKLLLSSDDGS